MRRPPLLLAAGAALLTLTACGGDGAEPTVEQLSPPSAQGIPFPGNGAGSAGTGEEHCSGGDEGRENARIEMAFTATVRSAEALDDGSEWVTFDVEQWFTDDLGTELALFARDWDGMPGERWLVASSRYDVHGLVSGDVFPCASERFGVTALANWELLYGPPVEAGAGTAERLPAPGALAAIDEAEARWTAAGLADHTYAVLVHDRSDWLRAPDDRCGLGMIRVVVEAGEVVEARDVSNHCDIPLADAPTMDELFALTRATAGAADAPTEPAEGSGTTPTFDPDFGFPRAWAASDRSIEVSIWTEEFAPRAIPLAGSDPAEAVARARATWEASGITSYDAVVEVVCFCDVPGPFEVTVVDGEITSDVPIDWIVPTVDGLFDHVEATRLNDEASELAFDPDLGYPVALRFEGELMTVDDELQLYVHELTPRP